MNEKTIEQTQINQEVSIDTTAIAKEKTQIIDTFFSAIKRAGEIFSEEDIDVAMKALKVASLEMKEKERKRRLEEEAILKEKKELEERKKQAAVKQVATIAHHLKRKRHAVDVVEGSWAWVKSRIIYPWFSRHSMTDKKFVVDADRCTHCGACVKNCPMQNISLKAGELPKWNGTCAMCLACIHRCPTRAIDYARATQKKGRYFFK